MKKLALCLVSLMIVYCTNPLEEEQNRYSVFLTGKVMENGGRPIAGAVASLPGLGVYDITGSDGVFTIALEEITSELEPIADSAKLEVLKDKQLITSYKLKKWIDTLPDIYIIQRDIYGSFTALPDDSVGQIRANISQNDALITKDLWYNSQTNSFSGFAYFKHSTDQMDYSVVIELRNNDGALIGRSSPVTFNSNAGDIQIAAFNPNNAVPSVEIIPDEERNKPIQSSLPFYQIDINDSLWFIATTNDPFGDSIVKYFWALDGVHFLDTTEIGTIGAAYSVSGDKEILVKVMDSDSLFSEPDTFSFKIVETFPSVSMPETAVYNFYKQLTDSICLKAAGVDQNPGGTVVSYIWALDGEHFEDTTSADSIQVAFTTSGEKTVKVMVIDNDGLLSEPATGILYLKLFEPNCNTGPDTSVLIGTEIHLHGRATDEAGIVKYEWKIGNGEWVETSTADTTIIAPDEMQVLTCSLRVTDTDGNQSTGEVNIFINDGTSLYLDNFDYISNNAPQSWLGALYGNLVYGNSWQGGGYWYTFKDHSGSSVNTNGTEIGADNTQLMVHDGILQTTLTTSSSTNDYPYAGFGCNIIGNGATYYDLSDLTALIMRVRGSGTVRVSLETSDIDETGQGWGYYGKMLSLTDEWTEVVIPVSELTPEPYSKASAENWTWEHGKYAVRSFMVQVRNQNDAEIAIDYIKLEGLQSLNIVY